MAMAKGGAQAGLGSAALPSSASRPLNRLVTSCPSGLSAQASLLASVAKSWRSCLSISEWQQVASSSFCSPWLIRPFFQGHLKSILSRRHWWPGRLFSCPNNLAVSPRCRRRLQDAPLSSEQAVLQPSITPRRRRRSTGTMPERKDSGAGRQGAGAYSKTADPLRTEFWFLL